MVTAACPQGDPFHTDSLDALYKHLRTAHGHGRVDAALAAQRAMTRAKAHAKRMTGLETVLLEMFGADAAVRSEELTTALRRQGIRLSVKVDGAIWT
ncbi:hypothetical protein [Parafrankia sp. FMc2]|uniref:hypothetical protein n=1 Tax=Parafrankia sp. FMc2 TaxID=3233196 RepID=UPI0034D49A25